jgi:NAD(P)-dependent dehydrogenase (short-subunit alcohol dehydrogenase family)
MDYLTKLFGLKNKTAAIIGAGGYLCSEMARGLSKAGVSVALLDKNLENLNKVSLEINSAGGRSFIIQIEVTDKKAHEKALELILKKYKDVDILINGAGINAPTPFFDIKEEEWDAILNVHLTGTFLGCQVFGKHMVKKKKGSIINMSSVSAGPALSKAFTYSVAKASIWNLTQNLAREWAQYNVRVNALRPGFFPTEWSMKHFIDKKREKAILGHTPMARYGKPQELVGAMLWLASDAASFVTGAHITVDGGFTAMTI